MQLSDQQIARFEGVYFKKLHAWSNGEVDISDDLHREESRQGPAGRAS